MLHLLTLSHVGVGGVLLGGTVTTFALGDKQETGLASPLSHSLSQLTWFITQVSLLLILGQNKSQNSLGGITLLVTEGMHLFVFFTANLLTFFVFYEAVLVPLTFLISQGGSGAGRLRAGILFFVYTIGGSAPILIATLYLISTQNAILNKGAEAITSLNLYSEEVGILWLAFGGSFAIKTPLYPFLIWLIHAHTESPLEGSIILAGVVLKLAIFGVSVILTSLLWEGGLALISYALTLGLVSLLLASGAILQQLDLKGFVALSSVAHIGIGTIGIICLTEDGISGAWLLALAHGLVSPCLFLIAGGVIYRSFASRLIYPFRGGGIILPFIGLTFLIATLANIATPPSPNWESEAIILVGLAQEHKVACFMSSSSVTLVALYSIWLYNRLIQGETGPLIRTTPDMSVIDSSVLVYTLSLVTLIGILSSAVGDTHSALSWNLFL